MAKEWITVTGAREHNLKNVTVRLPRGRFTVVTGLSGSGKSSLAFDTIYAEGQRRYVESLSNYARQFMGQMPKPDVDLVSGLSPSVSISQKSTGSNPRSTVGTITEIYDFLRLLMARLGEPTCYRCGAAIRQQTIEQIQDRLLKMPAGTKTMILAPLVRGRKGVHRDVFEKVRIMTLTDAIPNDTMSFSPDFPEELRGQILDALIEFTASEACLESICGEQFYSWTGVEPIEDAAYDPIRRLIQGLGYTEEDIFGG